MKKIKIKTNNLDRVVLVIKITILLEQQNYHKHQGTYTGIQILVNIASKEITILQKKKTRKFIFIQRQIKSRFKTFSRTLLISIHNWSLVEMKAHILEIPITKLSSI